MGNMHLVNVACVLAFFAFQIHILTMASSSYILGAPKGHKDESKDNVIQAFVIIAYALFIIGLILSVMMTRSGLSANNFAAVITAIVLLIAAGSVVIFLAVYNNYLFKANSAYKFQSHHITTFTTGGACGLVSGILLLIALCC